MLKNKNKQENQKCVLKTQVNNTKSLKHVGKTFQLRARECRNEVKIKGINIKN